MMFILEHFGYILVLSLLSILAFVVNEMYIAGKYIKKMHIREIVKEDECIEARNLLLFHLMEDGISQKRTSETEETGCTSLLVLCNSNDLVKLIEITHLIGGQIVLRKVCDQDIEDKKYAKIDVQKVMTKLDIDRAKRIERRKRR